MKLKILVAALAMSATLYAQGRGQAAGPGAPAAPPTPRALAPFDVTGYWVAIISEDWRWRMVTPARGDVASIPLTPAGLKTAEAWDPAKDEAAGEQCRAYGAPGLMRAPTRLHITWLDDDTIKIETDYGMQTRLFEFASAPAPAGAPTWQGLTTAQWVMPAGRGAPPGAAAVTAAPAQGGAAPAAAAPAAPRFGSMKTVTTRLKPGYLRKNGVPYSGNAVFTEYWDTHRQPNGDQYLIVTNVVDDSVNLQSPWMTSIHFKKEPDGSKWDPTPCSARF